MQFLSRMAYVGPFTYFMVTTTVWPPYIKCSIFVLYCSICDETLFTTGVRREYIAKNYYLCYNIVLDCKGCDRPFQEGSGTVGYRVNPLRGSDDEILPQAGEVERVSHPQRRLWL